MRCHEVLFDHANVMPMTHTYVDRDVDIPVDVGFRTIGTRQRMNVKANNHTSITASVFI
jgi:hypothetical protein